MLPKMKKSGVALATVLLLGLSLRIFQLGAESIWGDEGFSIRLASMALPQLLTKGFSDPSPPLYYAMLHYWISFLGSTSEISVRLLSVAFGFLSVLLIYSVGVSLFNRGTGLIASFIMAVSVFQIEYSQTTRAYSLMVFLTLLSFYLFLKLFSEHGLLLRIAYICSTCLLMYSHAYGLFIVAVQVAYFLLVFFGRRKQDVRLTLGEWFALQVALAVLYVPAAIQLTLQVTSGQHLGWVPVPSNTAVLETLVSYSGSVPLFAVYLFLSVFAAVRMAKLERGKLLLLALWLLVPLLVPFVVSKLTVPIFFDRDAIAAAPALYLLAARGVDSLGGLRNLSGQTAVKISVLVAIAIFSLPVLFSYFALPNNDQWRPAVQFVEKTANSGDVVVISPGPGLANAFNYYSVRQDLEKIPFPPGSPEINREDVESLQPALEGKERVWFIYSKNTANPQLLEKRLEESYGPKTQRRYHGVQLKLYEKSASS